MWIRSIELRLCAFVSAFTCESVSVWSARVLGHLWMCPGMKLIRTQAGKFVCTYDILTLQHHLYARTRTFVSMSISVSPRDSNSMHPCLFPSKKTKQTVLQFSSVMSSILQFHCITIWLWKAISQPFLGRFWKSKIQCKGHGVNFVKDTSVIADNAWWVLGILVLKFSITSADWMQSCLVNLMDMDLVTDTDMETRAWSRSFSGYIDPLLVAVLLITISIMTWGANPLRYTHSLVCFYASEFLKNAFAWLIMCILWGDGNLWLWHNALMLITRQMIIIANYH